MEHEWFVEYIDDRLFDLEFVLFEARDSELHRFIGASRFRVRNYPLPNKYLIPFYICYFTARMLFSRPDFVHCHLFQASIIGILSARLAGVKKRIYTRHHADVHHVYFPNAVKYDRLVNRNATRIIAVSKVIRELLTRLEHVDERRITVIPHGLPQQLMSIAVSDEQILQMKKKYGLEGHYPVVGVISRFVPEKGIQYVIPAFRKILSRYPSAKLVLANAKGRYREQLMPLIEEIPENSRVIIPFESNINPLFKSFDVFVHAAIDGTCEAFGQIYIEALNLGVPMVCTISGIAADLIVHEQNALVAEYKDPDAISELVTRLLNEKELRERLIMQGKKDVQEYTFEKKIEKISNLYLK